MEPDKNIPVTHWLNKAAEGDPEAQQKLWQQYYRRLVGLARTRMQEGKMRMADENDVVLEAFDAFFRGAEEGRFPQLNDRNDLWQVLVMLTCRKSSDQMKFQNRQRRGQGLVRGESIFQSPGESGERGDFDDFSAAEATPEFALDVVENYSRLLEKLGDSTLREIAVWKMEGLQNSEISEKLGTSTRTVERKLRLIRDCWADEV